MPGLGFWKHCGFWCKTLIWSFHHNNWPDCCRCLRRNVIALTICKKRQPAAIGKKDIESLLEALQANDHCGFQIFLIEWNEPLRGSMRKAYESRRKPGKNQAGCFSCRVQAQRTRFKLSILIKMGLTKVFFLVDLTKIIRNEKTKDNLKHRLQI